MATKGSGAVGTVLVLLIGLLVVSGLINYLFVLGMHSQGLYKTLGWFLVPSVILSVVFSGAAPWDRLRFGEAIGTFLSVVVMAYILLMIMAMVGVIPMFFIKLI